MESLARVCLPLPADTVVLPGHGPDTTIGAERASNPFLVPLVRQAAEDARRGPAGGGYPEAGAGDNTRARRL